MIPYFPRDTLCRQFHSLWPMRGQPGWTSDPERPACTDTRDEMGPIMQLSTPKTILVFSHIYACCHLLCITWSCSWHVMAICSAFQCKFCRTVSCTCHVPHIAHCTAISQPPPISLSIYNSTILHNDVDVTLNTMLAKRSRCICLHGIPLLFQEDAMLFFEHQSTCEICVKVCGDSIPFHSSQTLILH